ncbi:hypothetical protein J5N97_002095 [Dioscorea zingiberensis]|uniref:Fungal lipase-like domain-containing protein n=1 Tax=Dioscorea zingiberensis TaxID=325984 RepID=A0A9D5D356_9LILI|nr:hypothetical protein J5N97_002095 [Dioscorea zingiberensis]
MEAEKYQIDLGNLMAYDPSHHFPSLPDSREELTRKCLESGVELVQASADALFSLPSIEDPDGPIVSLPEPTTKLPREKHALAVVEYLIANGSDRAVDDILECSSKIAAVSSFEYVEPNGKDLGINVRKKAETILGLGRHFRHIQIEQWEGGIHFQTREKMRYAIVRSEKAGLLDLLAIGFLCMECYSPVFMEDEGAGIDGEWGPIPGDHRWVIVVSIILRKIIALFRKPMEWNGVILEFLLNLLSLNGGLSGLLLNLLAGNVTVPRRGSETFMSVIGHLDTRVDLYKGEEEELQPKTRSPLEIGSKALMDLCMMASKLAYENANVVKNIVVHHWKMHFVDFYNCWDDYQKEKSTQVFILCDKAKDASLILVSFRGTEPFDADDWCTDFDYSWYEIPKMGKVHMGFLEALGLGSRAQVSTFHANLQGKGHHARASPNENDDDDDDEITAYYAIRENLKSLLSEHKNAKFIITGHSLGGALAILFPALLLFHKEEELMKRFMGVYTFGQPRVGDRQLERFKEAHLRHPVHKFLRVVYCNDLVPRLPYDDNNFLYKHFGQCIYYNSLYIEECVDEEPNRNYFGLRYLLPLYLNATWELIRSLVMGCVSCVYGPEYKETWTSILLRIWGLAMPGISAHSPTNYVNSIRLGKRRH